MRTRSFLSWLFVSSFLAVSCGDDAAPAAPFDSESDPAQIGNTGRDAGNRDAGAGLPAHDGGTRQVIDAGKSPGRDDPTKGDPVSDEPPVVDAGHPDAGANTGRPDAGKPVPTTHDAGSGGCDTLTYESFGQAFLSKYCVSCHGGFLPQKNIKLDSLSGVQTSKSKVKAEVASSSMPPRGSAAPTSAERQQLAQWIDCGPK